MRMSPLKHLDIQTFQREQVRNTKSVGKIELLAVAAAGIYSPNQNLNGHLREDAVSEGILYRYSKPLMLRPKRQKRWRHIKGESLIPDAWLPGPRPVGRSACRSFGPKSRASD